MRKPQLLDDVDMKVEIEKKVFGSPLLSLKRSQAFWRVMRRLSKVK